MSQAQAGPAAAMVALNMYTQNSKANAAASAAKSNAIVAANTAIANTASGTIATLQQEIDELVKAVAEDQAKLTEIDGDIAAIQAQLAAIK
jgi:prefoldin subunit 5